MKSVVPGGRSEVRQWLQEQSVRRLGIPLAIVMIVWAAFFYFFGFVFPDQAEALMQGRVPAEVLDAIMRPWRKSIMSFGLVTTAIVVPSGAHLLRIILRAKHLLQSIEC